MLVRIFIPNIKANTNIRTGKLILVFVSIPALVCFVTLEFINIHVDIKAQFSFIFISEFILVLV